MKMKRLLAILLSALCVLMLTACGTSTAADTPEGENEKADIACMDAAETLAMNLWLKQQKEEPELCAQLAGDGVFYDPTTDSLVADAPTAGYGRGTVEDGGESWGYYCGVENGKGAVQQYDNTFDYTNSFLRVQYNEEADIYYMNWESVK